MTESDGGRPGRDVGQAAVAVVAVLALILSAALVPALTVPFPTVDQHEPDDTRPEPTAGGEPSAVGALSPGGRDTVGGPVDLQALPNGTNATHFVVESAHPAYWRTGAYGRYTGQGWDRLEDPSVYSGGMPAEGDRHLHQEVTLRRPAKGLPAAWKPTRVDFRDEDRQTLFVSRQGALMTQRAIPAGTEYSVASARSQPSPAELRAAGTDYPNEAQRYTRMPDETPHRVVELTDRITGDANSPYESAVAIERWLEESKGYSLQASHNTSRPVADQFIFEMDAGYCEYFATSMVVMLRSQGIPARYVVGYAPGQQVGADEYRVRSIDAHAWVEVYFPDHGWVRFDPTPPADRVLGERRALANDGVSSDRRAIVEGSPGEFESSNWGRSVWRTGDDVDWEMDGDENRWTNLDPDDVPSPPYNVTMDSRPVPGKDVVVTVKKDGIPVAGAIVTFDGEVVGRTDWNGRLDATIPYADQLHVAAAPPWQSTAEVAAGRVTGAGSASVVTGDRTGAFGAVGTPAIDSPAANPAKRDAATAAARRSMGPDTYDLPTNVTFGIEGQAAEGESFVLAPEIHGVPVRDATVEFDGREVGSTGADGAIRIHVPADAADPASITVSRGDVSATGRIDLADMRIELVPHTLLPIPGQEASAKVYVGDRPVENAEVWMDGERVGETDAEGTVDVVLPTDGDVQFRARSPYQSTTRTVGGLFALWGAIGGVLFGIPLLVGLVSVSVLWWRGHPVGEAPSMLAQRLRAVGDAIVSAGRWVWSGLTRVWGLAVQGGVWLARAAVSTALLVGGTALAVAQWVLTTGGSFGTVLSSLVIGVGTWVADHSAREAIAEVGSLARRGVGFLALSGQFAWLLVLGVVPMTGVTLADVIGADPSEPGGSTAGDPSVDPGSVEDTGRTLLSVREVWDQFLGLLGLADARTMTPAEIGRAAVDRGFPGEPVETITRAFRDVEYGGRSEGDVLRELVTDALGRLLADSSDETSGGPGGDD